MSKRVILVTGCSAGGIGFSLCEEFARKGCKVYATARNVEKMAGFKSGLNIETLQMDVINDLSVKSAIEKIVRNEGKIDVLVNNAGLGSFGPVLEVPLEEVQSVYDANVFSILRVSRAVLPHMAERKEGRIINISSIVAEIPVPWSGIYASTKAAVSALTGTMEMECRPFNIKVMLVAPGGIRSKVASNALTRFSLPENSLYKMYLNNIVARIWASQAPGTMDTDEFAKIVVGKTLASSPPFYLTLGANSIAFRVMKLLPRLWVYNFLWRRFSAPVK